MRREFPRKVKAQAFERSQGNCEGCGARLRVGEAEYDHHLADVLGGEPTLDNCRVLCRLCHKDATASLVKDLRKSDRIRDRTSGALKSKRGFRGWRKFNGDLVWNEK